jgi:hypothetical protein
MHKTTVAVGLVFAAAAAAAAGFGLKPGLWQSRIIKQVVDGRDVTAQVAAASAELEHAMAGMAPEQRARMEAMMGEHSGLTLGSSGNTRMCISADEARRDKPIVDRERRCQPTAVEHSATRTTFTINCTSNGVLTTGKGEAVAAGDLITSTVDLNTRAANGAKHVLHNETELKYLGADCGSVKPPPLPKAPQ